MFFRKTDRGTLRDLWITVIRNHNVTIANQTRMEKLIMSMMDDVKAALSKVDDAVSAFVVVADELKKAYDYLKAHPVVMEDPALKDVANKLGAISQKASDEVAKLNVSGGVA